MYEVPCVITINQGMGWKAVVVMGMNTFVFKVANSWSLTELLFYCQEDQYKEVPLISFFL